MRLTTVVLAGIVAGAGVGGSLLAQEGTHVPFAAAVGGIAPLLLQYGRSDEGAIQRAFQSVLNREPTGSELRRYRVLMEENNWTEADIRRDLHDRPDYQRYANNRRLNPETIIRRAYQDILGRDPDPEGMRTYRIDILDRGWSEQDVREALRNSPEYISGGVRQRSADRIIRRAYQDILNREPDPAGFEIYRRNIVERGWDEQDVRSALRRSNERRGQAYGNSDPNNNNNNNNGNLRGRNVIDDATASDIVRRAYNSVLNREPDANGMRDYKARVINDHWSEQQVMNALRNSDEYRSKHR
jgi:TorA maturation chaperone TorD